MDETGQEVRMSQRGRTPEESRNGIQSMAEACVFSLSRVDNNDQ